MNPIEFLIEPFRYPFMQNALIALIVVGITSGVLGVFVILRRMAFIGDALAHTALPGVVAAFLIGANLFFGALIASVVTSLLIGLFSRNRVIHEDTAIGIAFSGMFALGIALMSTLRTFRDLSHVLFGNILGLGPDQLWLLTGGSLAVLSLVFLLRKELIWTSVDPTHAATLGLDPDRVRTLLLLLLAVTVTIAIQAAGVVLTSSLLITPAAAAHLITKRLGTMIRLAAGLSIGGGLAGLYLSFYLGVSSGAAIVLTNTLIFGLVWGIKNLGTVPWNGRPSSAE